MSSSNRTFVLGFLSGVGACTCVVLARRTWKKRRRHAAPRRFGGAIRLKPEHYDRYTQLHDRVWEGVLDRMYQSHMRNFTLYYHRETSTLFSHFEWIGHWFARGTMTPEQENHLFESDMKAVATDPIVKEWWSQCEPCQEPFSQWRTDARPPSRGGEGDWWAPLVCLCSCGHWPSEFSEQRRDPDLAPCNPKGDVTEEPKIK